MNDRETLELAAKAADVPAYWSTDGSIQHHAKFVVLCGGWMGNMPYEAEWNPLKNDYDCARMEAFLGINITWGKDYVAAKAKRDGLVTYCVEFYADHDGSRYEARRHASTRVAAEIGKMIGKMIDQEKIANDDKPCPKWQNASQPSRTAWQTPCSKRGRRAMTDRYRQALEGLRERCAQEAERITARRRTVAALSNNEAMKPCEVAAAIRKIDVQQYCECAAMEIERLAEALEEIRGRSSMNLAMQPDPFELTARLGDIYQIADAALAQKQGEQHDNQD